MRDDAELRRKVRADHRLGISYRMIQERHGVSRYFVRKALGTVWRPTKPELTGWDRNYLDGAGLVEWMEERCGVENWTLYGEATTRSIHRWRIERRPATVYQADRVLIQLGCHLHELPDELWIEAPSRRPWPKEVREAAVTAYENGDTPGQISARTGVPADTILEWARRQRRKVAA